MTKQEIFDTVSVHLLKQGKQARMERHYDDGDVTSHCVYRASDGCMCAIGVLIPDDKYNPAMEGESVRTLTWKFKGVLDHLLASKDTRVLSLLITLQTIHDGFVGSWEKQLRDLAKNHELTTSAMDAFLAEQTAGTSTPVAA